ncbi:MAG: PIN domain-containing protein [Acidobacteriota bacterium]
MIALDTNVLIRFLVFDEPEQAQKATRLLEQAARDNESVLLSEIVLCEATWVLKSVYGASKRDIASTLRRLLGSEPFVVNHRDVVDRAIERYADGRGHFADYLIVEGATATGAATTVTFDKRLRNESGFTLLS